MYNEELTGVRLLEITEELNQFVQDFGDTYSSLQNELSRTERLKQDFLHLSENDDYGQLSIKYLNDLHTHLRYRRDIKNQLELLDAAKAFMESINAGRLKNCVGDMRKVRDRQINWVYNPKEMSSEELDDYMLGDDMGDEMDEYCSPDYDDKPPDQIDSRSA